MNGSSWVRVRSHVDSRERARLANRLPQMKTSALVGAAVALARLQPRTSWSSQPITADDIVVVGCDYLADEFHHDIRSLLAGSRRAARDALQDQCVVVGRECEGNLKTLQASAFGKAVLDLATQPRRVIELLDDIIGSTNASCD